MVSEGQSVPDHENAEATANGFGQGVGALLHVLLDLCKESMGAGILAILSPFSMKRFGFELYDPYSWIGTVPIAFGLVLLWELAVRKRGHRVWE